MTVDMGTNVILGLDPDRILEVPRLIAEHDASKRRIPPLWDGNASRRIVEVLATALEPAPAGQIASS